MEEYERYIFCISTGRAGSGYLAKILEHTEECESVHEAYPNFAGGPIQKFNTNKIENTLGLQRVKTKSIKDRIPKKPVYAELNHTFIKSWYVAAIDEFEKISVIWLRRRRKAIIESLMRLGTVPDMSLAGRNWYLRTDYPNNIIKYRGNNTPEDKCAWYVDEIEARAIRFMDENPDVPVHEVWLEKLNETDYVLELLEQLDLTPLDSLYDVIGKPYNVKPLKKRNLLLMYLRTLRQIAYKINPIKSKNRIHVT